MSGTDERATSGETRANGAPHGLVGVLSNGLTALRERPVVAWLIPAGVFLTVLLIGLFELPLYERLIREDGPIESATTLLAILTAVVAAVVAYGLWKLQWPRWLVFCWVLFAAGSFVLAGEEMSWGQRQLGFSGPDALTAANFQNEANAHNLLTPWALSAAYTVVGLYGAGVGHALWRRLPRVGEFADLLAPPLRSVAAPWFGVHAVVYAWYSVVEPIIRALGPDLAVDDHLRKLGEPSEFILGVGFLVFALESLVATRMRDGRVGMPSFAEGDDHLIDGGPASRSRHE